MSEECPDLIPLDATSRDQEQATIIPNTATGDDIKVPLTIITGYLGSGKTTLLQHILTANHGKRIAVLLNEFGDSMDIEKSSLVQTTSTNTGGTEGIFEEWIELRNGCICCSVKDAGVKAIENLLRKRGLFDYILLETTGLANPRGIISMFWLDSGLGSRVYLDGCVTVIDALNAERMLKSEIRQDVGSEFMVQLATADRIIINKVDKLSTVESVSHLEKAIKSMNAVASIAKTTYCRVDVDFVLDIKAYDGCTAEDIVSITANDSHSHDSSIVTQSITLPFSQKISTDKLDGWLESVLWEASDKMEIIRFKALVNATDGSVYIYQAVFETYDKVLARTEKDQDSRFVFIGRGLDIDILSRSLNRLF